MKKILLSCIFAICSINIISAQSFFDENRNISAGVHFGAVGQNQDLGLQIIMFNATIYGVYIDFGGWPQDHASDANIDIWDANKAFLFHVGYQVPVSSWLKITPLIGYANDESGYTNGYNWKVNRNGIHNQFVSEESVNGFDFGIQTKFEISISSNKNTSIDIMGTYTKYSWYGGLGLTFKI